MEESQYDLASLETRSVDTSAPVLLYESTGHAIFWLGISEDTAFRCNVYLVKDGNEGILVDPGGRQSFSQVRERLEQIMPVESVVGMILCHQDPDVAGSMVQWLELNPEMRVYSTPRTHVLLPHYGRSGYVAHDVEQFPELPLSSGAKLLFLPAPFLHFPGAFVTYDSASGYLFSGDIWAALDTDWRLVVADFEAHRPKMDLFHKDYMASHVASNGFVRSLAGLDIHAILPQHGSLIRREHVPPAMEYLQQLRCGLDLIYADATTADAAAASTLDAELKNSAAQVDDQPTVTSIFEHSDEESESPTQRLHEALQQAARLAKLRDKALHDLSAAERRLQAREELLDEAQRIAHVGNWVWRIGSDTITWSAEIYHIFGMATEKGDIRYAEFLRLVHPDDRERVEQAVALAIANNHKYDIQHRILRPDGQERIVHERAVVNINDSGEPVAMHGTVQDITEQKRAEEALAELQHYFQSIIDHMPSMLIGVDPEGRVTHWNHEASRLCGLLSNEATGKPLMEVCPILHEQAPVILNAITSNTEQKLNRVRQVSEGVIRYSDIMIYPLSRETSGGAVIRIDDVSERMRFEEFMLQSEKMQVVGGLGAGMAHELNNPIGGILYGLQNIRRRLSAVLEKNTRLAEQSGVDLEMLDHYLTERGVWNMLDHLEDAGQRASSIIDNMLKFSSASAAGMEPTDMVDLLVNTLKLAHVDYDLRRKYDFPHILVERHFSKGLPPVNCKGADIQQVVLNLLKNSAWAIHQSAKSSNEALISLRLYAQDRGVVIEVEDNGCGMSEETLHRLFEPFYTTKKVGEGAGLGLSSSYYIITEQHQGRLEVTSTSGLGTCFRIWLPCLDCVPSHPPVPS